MSELPKETVHRTYIVHGAMPRMVTPDLAWVGGCASSGGYPTGNIGGEARQISHDPCVAYVIMGSQKTIMVDPGHFGLWYSADGQLDAVLKGRQLDYVYVSHQEIPHTGNLGRLLQKYPGAVALGDVRDYHLFHPEVDLDRLQPMKHGDKVSLGDRDIVFLDAIWKDLSGTMYVYDTKLKLMYTPDIFGHIHYEHENVCSTMLHEMPDDLAESIMKRPGIGPIYGLKARDQKLRAQAFRNMLKKYPVEIITSGHCSPIMGPRLQPVIDRILAVADSLPRGLDFSSIF